MANNCGCGHPKKEHGADGCHRTVDSNPYESWQCKCRIPNGEAIRDDQKLQGLNAKYQVIRNDGQSETGKKHDGCGYWVIDLTHDPYADVVLLAYAKACRAAYPSLARDLLAMLHVDSITDEVRSLLDELEAGLRKRALHMDSMEGERGWT